jgi:hypothetical protein
VLEAVLEAVLVAVLEAVLTTITPSSYVSFTHAAYHWRSCVSPFSLLMVPRTRNLAF